MYYPAGVTVTAEKPLIYDKIENIQALVGAGGPDTTYQTTALSTFRQETASSSLDSSCSALCSNSDKHAANMQVGRAEIGWRYFCIFMR